MDKCGEVEYWEPRFSERSVTLEFGKITVQRTLTAALPPLAQRFGDSLSAEVANGALENDPSLSAEGR